MKVDRSKLSTHAFEHLLKLFTEAKWFYNYCLSQEDVNDSDTKARVVPVKTPDGLEDRNLSVLTAQMRQAIKTRLFTSMSSLKALKQNGHKIGRLKFKSRVDSVPLKQYDKTYFLDRQSSRVKLQGLKPWIRVRGLNQIPEDAEIANAVLVRKPSGFYLHITTYQDKQDNHTTDSSIGIDFGCQTQLTFSDGTKAEFQVSPSRRLRRLDRRIMRKDRPDSKKKRQDQVKRRKEYECLNNRRKDIRNKVVSAITSNFRYVCFQDESIHAWHAGGHGKKVQHSGIGGIIADLKHKSRTPCEVDKFFPSTQLCPECGQLNNLSQSDRTYHCDCGFVADRDWKSALCIEREGLKNVIPKGNAEMVCFANHRVPTDHRDFKAREKTSSTLFDSLKSIHGVKVSKMASVN